MAMSIAAACSDTPPPGLDPSVSVKPVDNCAAPNDGCACSTAGASVACGQVVSKQGDYVMCSEGKRTCDGARWGACKGDHQLYRSLGPLTLNNDTRPTGLGGGPEA